MDLYMQIGFLFAIMTAFATLLFYYSSITQSFIPVLDSGMSEVSVGVESFKDRSLELYDNNISLSGAEAEKIVRSSYNKKLAVFLQTKNQEGKIVNYGYQLRARNNEYKTAFFYSAANTSSPSQFEKSYVTRASRLFKDNTRHTIGLSASPIMDTTALISLDSSGTAGVISATFIANQVPVGVTNSTTNYVASPRIFSYHPLKTGDDAKASGKHYSTSGRFYTDQVLVSSSFVNKDYGFLNSAGSAYRLDKNARFYSVLIENPTGQVIGVYIEQHGINRGNGMLAAYMVDSGIITAPF